MEQTPAPIRIDVESTFTAINPSNGRIYNEYSAVVFYAADKRLIPALNAYKEACIKLGSDSNHILSIELLIDRVKLFQDKGPDKSNIIDRKFVVKATLNGWNGFFNQAGVIVFCAKDKAFPAFINECINIDRANNRLECADGASLKDLLDRVMFYQENIEAKVPDTNIAEEIQRCIHGVGVDADTWRYLEVHIKTVTSLGQLSRIPVSSNGDGKQDIYGTIIHVDDPLAQINGIFINSNGDNEQLDDWYRVYSYDDEQFLDIVKCKYGIDKEIRLDLKLRYIKTDEFVDFSKPDRQTINKNLSMSMICEVVVIHSIGDLLSLPTIKDAYCKSEDINVHAALFKSSIFGSMFRIQNGLTFINITGKNGSINDWHCVKSMDDRIFINTIRLANNIETSIPFVDVELRFKLGSDDEVTNARTHGEMITGDPHDVTKALAEEVADNR